MLEDLGYEYKNYAGYISYEKKLKNGNVYFISFNTLNKEVCKHQMSEKYVSIELKELKAIYNKCKELGWLDE